MDWNEGFSMAREILLLCATIGGVVVAATGLSTWKKQLKGSVEWELARRLLRCVYEVRDALQAVRNPFISGGEIASATETLGRGGSPKQGSETHNDGIIAAYQVRWERARQALLSLQVEILEAEVLWGKEAKDAVDPLQRCGANLSSHLLLHLRSLGGQPPSPAFADTVDRIIYASLDDEDAYAGELQAAVGTAEDVIRPKLER